MILNERHDTAVKLKLLAFSPLGDKHIFFYVLGRQLRDSPSDAWFYKYNFLNHLLNKHSFKLLLEYYTYVYNDF